MCMSAFPRASQRAADRARPAPSARAGAGLSWWSQTRGPGASRTWTAGPRATSSSTPAWPRPTCPGSSTCAPRPSTGAGPQTPAGRAFTQFATAARPLSRACSRRARASPAADMRARTALADCRCVGRGRSFVDGSLQASAPCLMRSPRAAQPVTDLPSLCWQAQPGMRVAQDQPSAWRRADALRLPQDFIKWENSELLRCGGRAFLLDYSQARAAACRACGRHQILTCTGQCPHLQASDWSIVRCTCAYKQRR